MSFWDKIKDIAMSAKCMTGWHGGNYTPIKNKPQCNLEKTCPDCGEYVTTIKHKFSDWKFPNRYAPVTSMYEAKFICQAEKKCIFCDKVEHKIIHNLYEDGKNSNCKIIKKCKYCSHEELGATKHNWSNMQDKRKCRDCGKIESKE